MVKRTSKGFSSSAKQQQSIWVKIKRQLITVLRCVPYVAVGLLLGFGLRESKNVMNNLPIVYELWAAFIGLLGGLYCGFRTEANRWIDKLLAYLGFGALGVGVVVSGLLLVWGLLCMLNRYVPYGASQNTYQAKIVKRAFQKSRGRFSYTIHGLHLFLPKRKAIYIYDSKKHFFRYRAGQDCVLHTRVGFLGIETMENLTAKPSPQRSTFHIPSRP